MKKPVINVLLSNSKYAKTNCYISQILEKLDSEYALNRIYLENNGFSSKFCRSPFPVFSLLQARILFKERFYINKLVKSSEIIIYDQDPWESIIDSGSIKDSYAKLLCDLNVKSFFVTSKWWANKVRTLGFPVEYVQMGVLERYHHNVFDYHSRRIPLFFQGTLHEYRKLFFQYLEEDNIRVNIKTSAKYTKFISNLRKAKIFIHTSPKDWRLDNQAIASNCCWIKDLEAVSQGCISIRNIDEEYLLQEIDKIPAIRTFNDYRGVRDVLGSIDSMTLDEIKEITNYSKFYVSKNMNWDQIVWLVNSYEQSGN